MSRPGQAYNAPVPGYVAPRYLYRVVMQTPDGEYTSIPLPGDDVDRYIGYKHRSGWQYLRTEQVAQ